MFFWYVCNVCDLLWYVWYFCNFCDLLIPMQKIKLCDVLDVVFCDFTYGCDVWDCCDLCYVVAIFEILVIIDLLIPMQI